MDSLLFSIIILGIFGEKSQIQGITQNGLYLLKYLFLDETDTILEKKMAKRMHIFLVYVKKCMLCIEKLLLSLRLRNFLPPHSLRLF